jgi:23S rRNA (cytosine1962-C5)-methyltransferase
LFSRDQYELLDAGQGRKLERFGPYVLDRPSPPTEDFRPLHPERWNAADATFERLEGDAAQWHLAREVPLRWSVRHASLVFELRRTDFGHVGLFPEQADNWEWLAHVIATAGRPLKVLNLFAYTGGSTLAASAAGAEVVHIDSAKNVVAWARKNAELSGLADRPIRWIAEDALKFARRELRRGQSYDAVILDPPSYGHGPAGQPWKLGDHLPELLNLCGELTTGRRAFILLSCHTPGYDSALLQQLLRDAFGRGREEAGEMRLVAADGRELPCGHFARWIAP